MDKYIKIYDDVIDQVSCQALIDKFEDSHEYFETVHIEDGDAVISFEQVDMFKNEDAWKDVQAGFLELFQDHVLQYKIDCEITNKQWPEKYGYESIRMKRYLDNDYDRFDYHVDVRDHDTARRFLAFFIYLNEVDGGHTEFVGLNIPGTRMPYRIKPRRGRLVMFPPMWTYPHAGLKPIGGPKYFIHSYCHYE